MPFNPKSAQNARKKSKRSPAKKEGPSIKEKTTDCTQFFIQIY
tara:strand:- start:75 stop:203 length:129 start_codon:yes stop_codon:yes gene_type:complete